jgi:hypothetical protein
VATLSTDGSAGPTHNLCSGLVYTPIFGFDAFSTMGAISVAEGAIAMYMVLSFWLSSSSLYLPGPDLEKSRNAGVAKAKDAVN